MQATALGQFGFYSAGQPKLVATTSMTELRARAFTAQQRQSCMMRDASGPDGCFDEVTEQPNSLFVAVLWTVHCTSKETTGFKLVGSQLQAYEVLEKPQGVCSAMMVAPHYTLYRIATKQLPAGSLTVRLMITDKSQGEHPVVEGEDHVTL